MARQNLNRISSGAAKLVATSGVLVLAISQLLAQPFEGLSAAGEAMNIAIVLDMSGSMSGTDRARPSGEEADSPTRLDSARDALVQFIAGLDPSGGDQLALIVFGRQAHTQSPLTDDYSLVSELVAGLEEEDVDPTGAAIGDGLGLALGILHNAESTGTPAIILLTDGHQNAGSVSLIQAIAVATDLGVPVHVVLLGQSSLLLFVQEPVTGRQLVRSEIPLDTRNMRRLAEATGGSFAHVDSAVQEIVTALQRVVEL